MAQMQTLGRGRLMFGMFPDSNFLIRPPSGLKYFGNTPSFTISTALTNLEHYDADAGLRVKDLSTIIQDDQTAAFTTDNVSAANLALWYLGLTQSAVQAAATAKTETLAVASLDSYFQLGISAATPAGARAVANVAVALGGAAVPPIAADGTVNYTVDLLSAMLYVSPTSLAIPVGSTLNVTYDLTATTRGQVISGGLAIFGRLQFLSLNEIGPVRNHVYPFVKITPTGSYELKGDAWQAMQFSAEILSPPDGTPRSIIDSASLT